MRTIESLQHLWKDNREWSGLHNISKQHGVRAASLGFYLPLPHCPSAAIWADSSIDVY